MSDHFDKMLSAIAQHEAAVVKWNEITDSYKRPGRKAYVAEAWAADSKARQRVEAHQDFYWKQALMYGIAAIAESVKPRQPIPPGGKP
jgi:hypothetical protein